jgi:hypothetical protein
VRTRTGFRSLGTAAIPLALVLFAGARPSAAALQEAGQRRCIAKLNQAAARVAKAQGAVGRACLAAFAAGRPEDVGSPASAQLCLDADPFGKVSRAEAKTLARETKSCSDPLPEFGHTAGADLNTAVRTQARNLVVELFGDLDAAIAAAGSSAEAAHCQAAVLAVAVKVQDKTWAAAVRAKKLALATATSGPELAQALASAVGTDPRLARLRSRLAARVAEACAGIVLDGLVTVFGCGPDATSSPEALGACVGHSASCAVGFGLAEADGLFADLDFDLFDDGLANESCLAN